MIIDTEIIPSLTVEPANPVFVSWLIWHALLRSKALDGPVVIFWWICDMCVCVFITVNQMSAVHY